MLERLRHPGGREHREPRETIDQRELQQDVERFAGVAMDRVSHGADVALTGAEPELALPLMRRILRIQTALLDIAAGAYPEVNLLDMAALVILIHSSLETYWIPEVYGEAGEPLLEATIRSEADLRSIASRLVSPMQQERIRQFVEDWRSENPELREVEGVRLFSYSEVAGEIAADRASQARGLLASVRSATQSVDQALLLGERAIFLANRLPFLLRLQARLTAQEVVADGLASLDAAERLVERSAELRPLVRDAAALVEASRAAVGEVRELAGELRPAAPPTDGNLVEGVERILASANRLADTSMGLLEEARELAPEGAKPAAALARRIDGLVRRWLIIGGLVGVALIAIFWGGYILARRATAPERSEGRTAQVRPGVAAARMAGRPSSPGGPGTG